MTHEILLAREKDLWEWRRELEMEKPDSPAWGKLNAMVHLREALDRRDLEAVGVWLYVLRKCRRSGEACLEKVTTMEEPRSAQVIDFTKTRPGRWVAIRLDKCLVLVTKGELLNLLAKDPALFQKAIRRGKQALRERDRMRRAGSPIGGGAQI